MPRRRARALDKLVQRGPACRRLLVHAAVPDPRPRRSPRSTATPGRPGMADPDDLRPTCSLRWLGRAADHRHLGQLDDGHRRAGCPRGVRLTWPGGVRTVELDDGHATFPPMRTDQLRVQVGRPTRHRAWASTRCQPPSGSASASCGSTGWPTCRSACLADARDLRLRQRPASVEVNGTWLRHAGRCVARPSCSAGAAAYRAGRRRLRISVAAPLSLRGGDNVVERPQLARRSPPDSLVAVSPGRAAGLASATTPSAAASGGRGPAARSSPADGDRGARSCARTPTAAGPRARTARRLTPSCSTAGSRAGVSTATAPVIRASSRPTAPTGSGWPSGWWPSWRLVLLVAPDGAADRRRRAADRP